MPPNLYCLPDWHVLTPKFETFKARRCAWHGSHLASLGDEVVKQLTDELAGHESFVKSGARDVDRKRKESGIQLLKGILHHLHVEVTLLHAHEQIACYRERILPGHVRQANLISPVPLLPEMVSRNLAHLWNEAPQVLGVEEAHAHSPCLSAAEATPVQLVHRQVLGYWHQSFQVAKFILSSRKIAECKKDLTLLLYVEWDVHQQISSTLIYLYI